MSGMLIKNFFFFFSNQPKIDPPDPRNKKLTWYGLNMMFEYVSKLTYMINSVMIMRSRTLIITLLLISGDVELNPGPMTEEGEIF